MKYIIGFIAVALLFVGWTIFQNAPQNVVMGGGNTSSYFDNTGRDDVISGGVKMIPISTPIGDFNVWTKRVGNNPKIKVLLLHGGPGMTHEYFEPFDSYFPGEDIEYYYYDQLGSFYSDQPNDPSLLTIDRFVDEVEQVRIALGLGPDNFYLLGHSWGGILGIEYALEHQDKIKGLIISNMMASIPEYNKYANDVIMPALNQEALAQIKAYEAAEDYANPHYQELLMTHHYVKHVLRLPLDEWPDPILRSLNHVNPEVYIPMQGPSELGASGLLVDWDRMDDLKRILTPTLVIGAEYDTMDPKHMRWMAGEFPNGTFHYSPNGGHWAIIDDQAIYMKGVIDFIKKVDGEGM